MGSYGTIGWNFIEEAVIRDRGFDEETVLASLVQSYFITQGFVDSLTALNEELRELQALETPIMTKCSGKQKDNGSHEVQQEGICVENDLCEGGVNGVEKKILTSASAAVNGGEGNREVVLEGVRRRKYLQLLCLNEQYEQAAALLPKENTLKVKLLSMEAMKRAKFDQAAALLFLCETVGPMILSLSDVTTAHQIYVDTLAGITGNSATGWLAPSPCRIAREVNESLLENHEPSAIDVLILWSDWQAMMKTREESQKKGSFPFSMRTEKL